jgi:hypothetical protein
MVNVTFLINVFTTIGVENLAGMLANALTMEQIEKLFTYDGVVDNFVGQIFISAKSKASFTYVVVKNYNVLAKPSYQLTGTQYSINWDRGLGDFNITESEWQNSSDMLTELTAEARERHMDTTAKYAYKNQPEGEATLTLKELADRVWKHVKALETKLDLKLHGFDSQEEFEASIH